MAAAQPLEDQPRLLLVDDNAVALKVIGREVARWGYVVDVAPGGDAAWQKFVSNQYDVVVSDVAMPEVDGLEVLRRVKTESIETPVVMLASYSELTDALRAMRQGAFDYIIKDEIHVLRHLVLGAPDEDDRPDPLRTAIVRAVEHVRLLRQNKRLLRELGEANTELTRERAELERTLASLRETQGHLVEAEKQASVGVLVAGVGNEINNPLTSLLSNLGVLGEWCTGAQQLTGAERLPLNDEVPALLGDCQQSLEHIQRIVKELRSFSRQASARSESIDAMRVLGQLGREANVSSLPELLLQIAGPEQLVVVGHRRELLKALSNVVVNAYEACHEHHVPPAISINVSRTVTQSIISVHDGGNGVDASIRGRVFDPFFTTKKYRRAAGLGLSVARELVRGMGGDIQLESEVGVGTTVHICLHHPTGGDDGECGERSE